MMFLLNNVVIGANVFIVPRLYQHVLCAARIIYSTTMILLWYTVR